MKALLIDPYQKKIHEIDIPDTLQAWYAMLDCHCIDRAEIFRNPATKRAIDIWVDDEGLIKEPVPPMFKVKGRDYPLAGYGLVLGCDLTSGKSVAFEASRFRIDQLIAFEPWEKRLDPADYFDKLTRVPSWELA